jgi:DNA-binding transcriptional LysR family regulator
VEFRHLRYFVAVADELHFGRAAKKLGIRQPPLSQQIRRLEKDLGVPLFDRNSRRVQLTAAGRTLLPAARQMLAQALAAREAAQHAGRGETGQLALGFVGSATMTLLPAALRRFRATYPTVTLSLREMTTVQQVQALRSGGLDVGLLRPPLPLTESDPIEVEPVGNGSWWRYRLATHWLEIARSPPSSSPTNRSCCSHASSGRACSSRS